MRIRVSTALLIVGITLSPFALFGMEPLYLPEEAGLLRNVFVWVQYDLPIGLFAVCFLIALVSAGIFLFRKNWVGLLQCLVEVIVCFIGILCAPVY